MYFARDKLPKQLEQRVSRGSPTNAQLVEDLPDSQLVAYLADRRNAAGIEDVFKRHSSIRLLNSSPMMILCSFMAFSETGSTGGKP